MIKLTQGEHGLGTREYEQAGTAHGTGSKVLLDGGGTALSLMPGSRK